MHQQETFELTIGRLSAEQRETLQEAILDVIASRDPMDHSQIARERELDGFTALQVAAMLTDLEKEKMVEQVDGYWVLTEES